MGTTPPVGTGDTEGSAGRASGKRRSQARVADDRQQIDLAGLSIPDAGGELATRSGAERRVDLRDYGTASTIGAADDDPYDPGWLGVVLRWPVRVVAVIVIMPVQVVWESAKAATRALGKGLGHVGRVIARAADAVLGRPMRWLGRRVAAGVTAVGRGLGWLATRVLWWPLRWFGRGTGRTARWLYRNVLTPVGHGIAFAVRGIGHGFVLLGRGIAFVAVGIGAGAMAVLRPIGRGMAFLARGVRDGLGAFGRALYRWVLRPVGHGIAAVGQGIAVAARALGRGIVSVARPIGHALARLASYLFIPIRLAGRGIWFVLRLLGHWLVGLVHVIGEAIGYGARVGAAVGRGFVWLWTTVVWKPLRWVGRGLRTAWLSVWRPLRNLARRSFAPLADAARGIRRWYRHEISDPIRSALRAARRDVRRALTGRRQG